MMWRFMQDLESFITFVGNYFYVGVINMMLINNNMHILDDFVLNPQVFMFDISSISY